MQLALGVTCRDGFALAFPPRVAIVRPDSLAR